VRCLADTLWYSYAMMKNANELPPIYARFRGRIELCCPRCGTFLRTSIGYRTPFVVQCSNGACKLHWGIGLLIRTLRSGRRQLPRDLILHPARWVQEKWKHDGFANMLLVTPTTESEDEDD